MNPQQIFRVPLESVPASLVEIVFRPGDDRWDEVRQAWNLSVDQRPAAAAVPRTAEDVIALVQWAHMEGLRVSAQGTGHAAAAHASLRETLLVKTLGLDEVHIDAELERARVGAGAVWRDVSTAAAEFGLAALAGSGLDVGVVGYTLGGGISWLARRYGLAANSVLAVEVVTAQGRLVRADRYHEPELFWALRGGGGAFGVVTALEFELYPVAEVYAGTLFWPAEQAETVLNAWRDWTQTSPIEVTSCARLLNFPPLPDLPEPLRGRSFVAIEVAHMSDAAAATEQLRPLRALKPEIDTVATMPAGQLGRLHMDPDQPVPGVGNGGLLAALPSEAIAALLGVAGPGTDSPLLSVEIRHLGGALSEAGEGAGALASIDAPYGMYAVGMAVTPELKVAINARIDSLGEVLAPWQAAHGYLNFGDRPGQTDRLFSAETYQRLRAVKAAYDPADLFLSNHPILPGARREA
jgi:FAD/FMN-containing dehydrogenase